MNPGGLSWVGGTWWIKEQRAVHCKLPHQHSQDIDHSSREGSGNCSPQQATKCSTSKPTGKWSGDITISAPHSLYYIWGAYALHIGEQTGRLFGAIQNRQRALHEHSVVVLTFSDIEQIKWYAFSILFYSNTYHFRCFCQVPLTFLLHFI